MLYTLWNWTPMGKLATNSFHHSDFIPGTVKKCRQLAPRFATCVLDPYYLETEPTLILEQCTAGSAVLILSLLKTNKVLKSILRRLPRSHGTHCRSSDQRRIQGGAGFKVLISFSSTYHALLIISSCKHLFIIILFLFLRLRCPMVVSKLSPMKR